jgi:uncharacterized membrane protein YjgN (DUF898 family)
MIDRVACGGIGSGPSRAPSGGIKKKTKTGSGPMETLTIEAGSLEPATPKAASTAETRHAFEFRGSAAEYFRVWIVNLALTVLTLGIYSAWAKVRRLKYLHGHTFVDGSAFGYHGDPKKILKGRMVASLLLFAYVAVGELHVVAGAVAGLLLVLAMPWLVVKSLKFRMRMTSWRGLRFDFEQNFGAAYRVYLGWGALAALSLGLLAPVFVRKLNKFVVDHASFGTTRFESDPPLRAIYLAALWAVLFLLAVAGLGFAAMYGVVEPTAEGTVSPFVQLLPFAIVMTAYLGSYAIFQARVSNAVYGSTRLGPHRFHSDLRGPRLAWLYFTNTLAIVFSIGLLVPWATVRTLRYRLETLGLTAVGSLDELVAGEAAALPGATGEEVAEFFDVDFGL